MVDPFLYYFRVLCVKSADKSRIKQLIYAAQKKYSSSLAGKSFLYVYGTSYFEVVFETACFKHLTGVDSYISAKDFYKRAQKGTLAENQILFNARYPKRTALKKLSVLSDLDTITNSLVCVLYDIKTNTATYKLGVTNLKFTICLAQNSINNTARSYYVPQSLRVNDNSVANSADGDFIDFIFVKDAANTLYTQISYQADDKEIPNSVYHLIDESFYLVKL